MQVVVFEPKYIGHFLGFATFAANAYAKAGCDVTLVVPKGAHKSDQAAVKFSNLAESVKIDYSIDMDPMYDLWKNAKAESDALAEVIDRLPMDRLVIPSADFLIYGLLLKRRLYRRIIQSIEVDIIVHNSRQAYGRTGIREIFTHFVDRLALEFAHKCSVYSVDPYVFTDNAKSLTLFRNHVKSIPHPYTRHDDFPTKKKAREYLELSENDWVIGSIGDLGVRKGTELLIDSFARSEVGRNAKLVLFGMLSDDAMSALDRNKKHVEQGRIICRNEFVSDDDYLKFFAAMDLVWIGYQLHIGIASTLLFASDVDCPVLATDFGCIGWMVQKYGLGETSVAEVVPMSVMMRQMYEAFENTCGDQHTTRSSTAVNRNAPKTPRRSLIADHNTDSFESVLTAHLLTAGR